MQNQADNRLMENLYWWGVPTLFRCPHETNFENCDIGLIGVPHSAGNGTTERAVSYTHLTLPTKA